MSLQSRLATLITQLGTDYKALDARLNAAHATWPRLYTGTRYYSVDQGVAATMSIAQSSLYALPFIPPVNCTLNNVNINVNVAGAAGAVCRFGLFADNGSGYPGTLILDAGTVSVASTGIKQSIDFNQALTAGTLYWLGVVNQVAAGLTLRSRNGVNPLAIAQTTSLMATNIQGFISGATVTGALASNPAVSSFGAAPTMAIKLTPT